MPPAFAAIGEAGAAAILGEAAAGTAATVGAAAIPATAGFVALSTTIALTAQIAFSVGLSYALGALFSQKANAFTPDKIQQMRKSAISSRAAVYGEARVSGTVIPFPEPVIKTTIQDARPKKVEHMHLIVALATHECESIGDVYFDDIISTDKKFLDQNVYGNNVEVVRIVKHLGGPGQVADPTLVSLFPDVWTIDHRLDGMAYLYITLGWIESPTTGFGGWRPGYKTWGHVPNVTAVVKGKKVLDPRNPTAAGVWSNNWGCCMYDYLLDKQFGASHTHDLAGRIDMPSAVASANTSDETVQIFDIWNASVVYAKGDFIGWPNTNTGFAFKAVVNNTGVQPQSTQVHWISTAMQAFRRNVQEYDPLRRYSPGDLAEYLGIVYAALDVGGAFSGMRPDLSPYNWELETNHVYPTWDPSAQYVQYDIVMYLGIKYFLKAASNLFNVGQVPNAPNSTWWQVQTNASFEIPLHPLWLIGNNYAKGNLVIQNRVVYKAFIDNIGFDPTLDDTSTWLPIDGLALHQSRYLCNGAIDTSDTPSSIVNNMKTAGAGAITISGGKYIIEAGAFPNAAVAAIDEDDLSGTVSIQPRQRRKDLFDAVKGVYVNPLNGWKVEDFPMVHNPMYQAEDYGFSYAGQYNTATTYAKDDAVDTISTALDSAVWVSLENNNIGNALTEGIHWTKINPISKDIQLSYTTDPIAAQRIAKIFLERARQSVVAVMPLKPADIRLQVLDPITVSLAQLGWVNKRVKISKVDIQPNGTVNVTVHEDAANSYAWNFGDYTLFDPNPDTLLGIPADVTGLILQETMQLVMSLTSIVTATWTPPNDPIYDHANIYYRVFGAADWILYAGGNTPMQAEVLITGKTYQVQVNSVSSLGVESMTGPIGQITLDGGTVTDINPPINPTLSVTFDALRNVTDASIGFDFDSSSGTIPDGAALFWEIMPHANALTFGADSGSSVAVDSIDILDYLPTFDTVAAGSTVRDIVLTSVLPIIPGLVGQWWLRVTDGVTTSQWRKGSWIDNNTIHLASDLDVTPLAGWNIDVAMISWIDDRTRPTHKLFYANGEVFSWGEVTESSGQFSLTGLQRGLEGTAQVNLAGVQGFYFPAQGGHTHMRLIPRAEAVVNGATVSWSGSVSGVNVPLGSWASVTIALYKQIQNGQILRSNVVPLTVVQK